LARGNRISRLTLRYPAVGGGAMHGSPRCVRTSIPCSVIRSMRSMWYRLFQNSRSRFLLNPYALHINAAVLPNRASGPGRRVTVHGAVGQSDALYKPGGFATFILWGVASPPITLLLPQFQFCDFRIHRIRISTGPNLLHVRFADVEPAAGDSRSRYLVVCWTRAVTNVASRHAASIAQVNKVKPPIYIHA
jgi:hypothetical protein